MHRFGLALQLTKMPGAQPAELPGTGAGDTGGGGTLVWRVVAALSGVGVMLLGVITIWRRRRA